MVETQLWHRAGFQGRGLAAEAAAAGVACAFGDLDRRAGQRQPDDGPGLVYVYRRGAEGWVEHARLRASDAVERDGFGAALASNDVTLLIGAYGRGAAYVFQRQADGSWTESARLVATDALEGMSRAELPMGFDGDSIGLTFFVRHAGPVRYFGHTEARNLSRRSFTSIP